MEGKVQLFNSNDVKIGETFLRRAKQLIRQQRASWTDETQTAIRFAAGMENLDTPATQPPLYEDDKLVQWLIPRAEKRMRMRKWFVIHSFLFVALSYWWLDFWGTTFISIFIIWISLYGIHAYLYLTDQYARKRIAKRLSNEAAALRNGQYNY